MKLTGFLFLAMDVSPTTENMAKMIYKYVESKGLPVVEVTMWETPYSFATYKASGAA